LQLELYNPLDYATELTAELESWANSSGNGGSTGDGQLAARSGGSQKRSFGGTSSGSGGSTGKQRKHREKM
jgi:uncharacterized membrane protein YgcG